MSDPRPITELATSSPSTQAHLEQASEATGPFTPQSSVNALASAKQPPARFSDRYQLLDELARGGMGVVYSANDLIFDRLVAIKMLAPKLIGTTADRRFVREARITGRLQHPSIPPVHDLGTLEDGQPYLAMKLIRGQTFAATIKEWRSANKDSQAESFDKLIAIFEQICLAVAFAHSRRVIHRDLKPLNVMVGAFGEIQVMDWGLAKELESPRADEPPTESEFHDDPEERTMTGNVMGTLAYMPPEQACGETNVIDERADVFSLGAILCVILTGSPPYTGLDGHDVWKKASAANLDDAIARLNAVRGHGRLVALAKRCLQVEPSNRPAHAGEVAAAVRVARDWVAQSQRDEALSQATGDAKQIAEEAQKRFRSAIRIVIAVIAVSAWISYVAWEWIPSQYQSSAIDQQNQWLARNAALASQKAEANELLYDLEGAIARGMENGRFAPRWDGPYRDRIRERLQAVQRDLKSPQSHRARVLEVAMLDAAKSSEADSRWHTAVEEYRKEFPEHAPYRFALQLQEWYHDAKPFTALERTILRRVLRVLGSKTPTELPLEMQADIEKTRTRLNELGIKGK